MAPDTASAHSVKANAATRLCGANRPKLANSEVSQKVRRPTNAFGVLSALCWASSQRISPILPASVIACSSRHWSRLFASFKARSSNCRSSRMSSDCRGRHLADQSGHLHRTTACPPWPKSGHQNTKCVVPYFGGGGMAEEWWSTMSQSSPRFMYAKLYRAGKFLVSPSLIKEKV